MCVPSATGLPRPSDEMCVPNTTGHPRPPDEMCMPNTTGHPRPPHEMCVLTLFSSLFCFYLMGKNEDRLRR